MGRRRLWGRLRLLGFRYGWLSIGLCYLRSGLCVENGFDYLLRATPTTDGFFLARSDLRQLYQGQFNQQAFVFAGTIVQVAVVAELHGAIQEGQGAFLCLHLIAFADTGSYLKQGEGRSIFAHQQVAEV